MNKLSKLIRKHFLYVYVMMFSHCNFSFVHSQMCSFMFLREFRSKKNQIIAAKILLKPTK